MYPSTTRRFSATIGYVAPTPNHVQNIMFNNRKSGSQSHTQYAMNKMFEVEPSQGHKPRIPQIPQREHLRERPTKVGPHFAQEPTHTHSLPTTGPKNAQETPLQPLPPGSAPPIATSSSRHTKSSRSHQRLVSQGRGSKASGQIATALSSLGHTVCP